MRIAPAITLSPEQQTVLESQARSRSLSVRGGVGARSHRVVRGLGQQDKEIAAVMVVTPKEASRAGASVFSRWAWAGLQKDAHAPVASPPSARA